DRYGRKVRHDPHGQIARGDGEAGVDQPRGSDQSSAQSGDLAHAHGHVGRRSPGPIDRLTAMDLQDKLKLLSSVSLWENVPQDRLASLAEYLQAESHKAGETIFEEGSKGDGLYFISFGHVLIRKKITTPEGDSAFKDLALLGPGHCMGEMTLFDEVPRSAQAVASDECTLLKLDRKALSQWLKANPSLAA